MKYFFALMLLVAATAFTASAQTVMKVKMTSGETTEIPVNKIDNVTFGEISEPEMPEAGHPVDLGLSILWADRNVGSTSEFDPGIECGWGDPTGEKTSSNLDDYPCPFPPKDISGTEYDIARVKWGAPWRMPTKEEIEELKYVSNSTIKKSTGYAYGSYYMKVENINTGNCIYLPNGSDTHNYIHYYWTSTLSTIATYNAYKFGIAGSSTTIISDEDFRYCDYYIRPVMDKIDITTGDALNITANSAMLVGTVEDTGNGVETGFLYGTSDNLKERGKRIEAGYSRGEFNIVVVDLSEGSTYYYCAYVKMSEDLYIYGETKSFVAQDTYKVGDLWPDKNDKYNAKGVVFKVDADGLHGKVVSISYAENLAWDSNSIPSNEHCINVSDGSLNQMPLSHSPAGKWCANYGDDWYCPARGELVELNSVIDKVNNTLMSIPTSIHNGFYWSSTQYSATYYDLAYIVCIAEDKYLGFSGGWFGENSKSEKRRVCAVKKF